MSLQKVQTKEYDVIIVGGGIVGSALLYVLSTYTNISRIALIEKRVAVGELNSKNKNNSQTLHFGDIETHYTLKKSKEVQYPATLLKHFLYAHDTNQSLYKKVPKMVLAVGDKEVKELEDRFHLIKDVYPNIQLLQREGIARIEPNVVKGRDDQEKICALFSPDGYVVDFGAVAKKFVQLAQEQQEKIVDVFLETDVRDIHKGIEGNYRIETNKGVFSSKVVEVTAAGYSLYFAHKFGLAKNWTLANIIGNYYNTKGVLNGKVYRMQIPGLPFATVHGDPDVRDQSLVRFGPTAKAVLMLDREDYRSVKDYFSMLGLNVRRYIALLSVVKRPIVVKYMAMNVLYDVPLLGKRLFLQELRKIVPTLKASDLQRARGEGGVRPQIIDIDKKETLLGEGKVMGDNIIFTVTPSPGASVCLGNAEKDAKTIVEMLGNGMTFDQNAFQKDLYTSTVIANETKCSDPISQDCSRM